MGFPNLSGLYIELFSFPQPRSTQVSERVDLQFSGLLAKQAVSKKTVSRFACQFFLKGVYNAVADLRHLDQKEEISGQETQNQAPPPLSSTS